MYAQDKQDTEAIAQLKELIRVLHPGVIGLIDRYHSPEVAQRAGLAVTAAKNLIAAQTAPKKMSVYRGVFRYNGETIENDFIAPMGSDFTAKDAAFLASLAQVAEIDYACVGELSN